MDLTKVYISENDLPENKEEVLNDILNRIYNQGDTALNWVDAEDFLFWGSLMHSGEEFVFIDPGSDGKSWDLNGGSISVMERYKYTERVDFESWYAAIKEKFKI